MAVTSTVTKLPLATWARIVGIHPLHFAGISFTPDHRNPNLCDTAYYQWDWQAADRTSREQIAMSILQAEEMIERIVQFRLMPTWETDEYHQTIRNHRRELGSVLDMTGRRPTVRADWGHFISGGIEKKTLVDTAQAITWSADKRTGTVTVTVPLGTEACNIEAYYPGEAGADEWQIRPIDVAIAVNGVTATITIKRELAVLPELWDTYNPRFAVFLTDADFIDEVDVYTRENDPQTQATLLWEPGRTCTTCDDGSCGMCSYSAGTACLFLRSQPALSVVGWTPGTWDADDANFNWDCPGYWWNPDLIRLYYYAGYRARAGCAREMDMNLARAVAALAMTLNDRPACDCSGEIWEYWREDMAKSSTSSGGVRRNPVLENPFGTMRGAIFAWERVKEYAEQSTPQVAAVF